ncbi:MAG TPA: PAS domain S-box protein [Sphingomonas sp.]|nr:PAS domain S-box protein [Sphingomonas sp.]
MTLGIDLIAPVCGAMLIGIAGWLTGRRTLAPQLAPSDLRAALDATSIALTGDDGVITHWSRGCEALYGWTAAEAVGRNKYDLLSSTLPDGTAAPEARFETAGEQELLERCKDGATINVIERHLLLARRPHRHARVVLKMLDISDRVSVESALRESEARLATATAAARIGVSDWDVPNGTIEWSSGSAERLGFPPGGINNFAEWEAQVDPDDVRDIMATVARAAAVHQERIDFGYRLRQADGSWRTVQGVACCVYDAAGELVQVVGTNIDVTERVEREAALKAREAQLRSVLEAAPSPMVVTDGNAIILEFSPAAERLWGYAADEVLGRSALPLIAPEDHARFTRVVTRQPPPEDSNPVRPAAAATAIAKDGTRLSIEVYYGHARTPSGYLITLFCHDVSERLAAEQRFAELSAELNHVARQSAMSELAADLAHELNQPLSATANFLAAARMLIDQGEDGPRVGDLLRMAEEQTLRSGEIIRRLRDFLAKRDAEKSFQSIENIVREAVDLILFGTAQYDIRLTYDLDRHVDRVFADRIQLQQVLVNLLRNAVDALLHQPRDAREIIITSRATTDGMAEIAVSDSGPGLADAVSEELYSRFATTKTGSAMGIGLSISRRIVEAHGGTLVAENRPGGGATFRLTLPIMEEVEE